MKPRIFRSLLLMLVGFLLFLVSVAGQEYAFLEIKENLLKNRPITGDPQLRKKSIISIDDQIFNNYSAGNTKEFYTTMIQKAIQEIKGDDKGKFFNTSSDKYVESAILHLENKLKELEQKFDNTNENNRELGFHTRTTLPPDMQRKKYEWEATLNVRQEERDMLEYLLENFVEKEVIIVIIGCIFSDLTTLTRR